MALLLAIGWLIAIPGWEPGVAVLTLAATMAAIIKIKKREMAQGGAAIRTEGDVDLVVENRGGIQAGRGGYGGAGGDAIRVAPGPGVKVRIINEGEIVGGDAAKK